MQLRPLLQLYVAQIAELLVTSRPCCSRAVVSQLLDVQDVGLFAIATSVQTDMITAVVLA